MSVHDVPRRRWVEVLQEFTRGHRGWLASVVTVGPGPELVSRTESRPLESIAVAQTCGRPTAVCVRFRGAPTVVVKAPRTLAVDRRGDGADRALEIDAANATFVRIAFRATALPEELDGIAPAELVGPEK
jgi:hypothetical protein